MMNRRDFILGSVSLAVAPGMAGGPQLERIEDGLWRLAGDDSNLNGWLIVRDGHSLLVDCPSLTAASKIAVFTRCRMSRSPRVVSTLKVSLM